MPDASGNLQAGDPGYVEPGKGLLNTQVGQTNVTPGAPVTGYTAAQAPAMGYTSVPYEVPKAATVQEQVKDIVGQDSPLMQQAESIAKQKSNERGLLNSSLGVGAAQQAVIAQALPMAQQTAQTYAQAATNTANQQNAALQFGAQATNVAALNNAAQVNDAFKSSLQSATQLANTKMSTDTQLALGNLDVNSKLALTTAENNYKQLLQSSASASNAYVQAATNITNIAMNKDMSKEARDAAIAAQTQLLNEQLRTISGIASTRSNAVSALNLSQYFQGSGSYTGSNVTYPGANGVAYPTQTAANQSFIDQGIAQGIAQAQGGA